MRRLGWFRRCCLFGALVCVVALPVSAQNDISDEDWLTELIEDSVSSENLTVDISNFRGALSSTAQMDALTVADAQGVWLRMEGLTLSWDRGALLSGAIDIETLAADRIIVNRLPQSAPQGAALPNAEATPFSLPELPVSVAIDAITADIIEISPALLGEPITASFTGALNLANGAADAVADLSRTDAKTGRFLLNAGYDNASRNLRLRLSVEEGPDGLAVRALSIPGAPTATLSIAGEAPVDDFTADITLATEGTPRITGAFALSRPEPTADLGFALDLTGDLRPLMDTELEQFFGTNTVLKASGTLPLAGGARLNDLILATGQLALRGTADLTPTYWPRAFDLRGRIGTGTGDAVQLPFSAADTFVDHVALILSFDAAQGDGWLGAFDITGLARDGLTVENLALSGGGTLTPSADGSASTGRFTAALDYAAHGLALRDRGLQQAVGPQVTGTVILNRQQGAPLNLSVVTLNTAGLSASGRGQIEGPAGRFETHADLQMTSDDFTRFSRLTGLNLSGAGQVDLSLRTQPLDGSTAAHIDAQTRRLGLGIDTLDRLLTGPARLQADLERDTAGTRLRNLTLDAETFLAQGDATLTGDSITADLTAQLHDLSRLQPGLHGAGQMNAQLRGTPGGRSTMTARITAPTTDLTLTTDAIPQDGGGYRLTPQITASLSDLSHYRPLIGSRLGGSVTATLNGSYDTESGLLTATAQTQTRNLIAGPPSLDPVLRGNGTLRADLSLNENRRLRVDAVQIDLPNLDVTGAVTTTGTDTAATFSARLRDLGVVLSDFPGPLTADINARQHSTGWRITGQADGPGGTTVQADGGLTNNGQLNMALTGSAPLALANRFIAPRRVSGLARFDLSANGPPGLTALQGPIRISDGQFSAPTLSQSIENLTGTVQLAAGTARIDLTGAPRNGGALSLSGPVDLTSPFQAGLTAQLDSVVLRDPTLYRTTADGTVSMTGPLAGGASITGQINLGPAEIQVPSTGVSALGSLPEVTHLGPRLDIRQTLNRAGVGTRPQTTRQSPAGPAYPLDLTIRAPSRIFVRGRGLDAELGGALRLTGSSQNVIPIGRFDLVRGRLNILGQRFELSEGFAQLEGDFTPFLSLTAATESDLGTAISIIAEGRADDLKIRFTSSPEMPEDEVLAQLLFGRDLSSLSPFQAVQLASAVAVLAGNSNGGFVTDLRENLDLDDLELTSDEDGDPGIRAGKYISENVYTDVSVGSDGRSEININIDIDRNFTARGSVASDGETSIGIFFERDY